jgi:hypothetical protein
VLVARGGGDAVLVDVRNGGVVLGEDGEYERRGTSREVVECVEGDGADEEGEEERGGEGGECEGCENE